MKGTLFAIVCLLFISSSIAQDFVCYSTTAKCSTSLGACSFVVNNDAKTVAVETCPNNQYCNRTTGEDFISYTGNCLVALAIGADCTSSDTCVDGSICANSVCTAIKVVGINEACDTTNLCQNNLYCLTSNNTCQFAATNGQNCSSDLPCVPGFFCNSADVCVAAYSLRDGAECDGSDRTQCGVGLGCALDMATTKFTCKAPVASSNRACTGSSDISCENGEICLFSKCNATGSVEYSCQNTIVANTAEEKDDYEDLSECKLKQLTNVCSRYSSASCAQCLDDACDADVYDEKDNCGNGICQDNDTTTTAASTTTSDSSILSLSIFSLACALLLAM